MRRWLLITSSYSWQIRCAPAEGQAVSKLAVVEDPEGWHVAGLRSRLVRNPDELLQAFEAGCQLRDHGFMDLGNVHERTAAVFTVRLAQFNPAADAEDEDTAMVCMCDKPCLCLASFLGESARRQK